jgi:2-phosphoglycerate kinase
VLVGVHAALERAATERWSMVLEGVHLVPGMVTAEVPDAFVVQCVIVIEDENLHRSHFWVRDYSTEGLRPLEKYLDSLPQIREIQDYLIERARRHDVPVIVNGSLDHAIAEVMDLVLKRADQLVATA